MPTESTEIFSLAPRGYVNGQWVDGDGEQFKIVNPSNEEVISRPTGLTSDQVNRAVMAASAAFDTGDWTRTNPEDRSALLTRLADLIERDAADLAAMMVAEIGTPSVVASGMQVPYPINNLRWYADATARLGAIPDPAMPICSTLPGQRSLLIREPIGVVAAVVAYNFPLNLAAWKVGGALAAGCTVVMMCSPKAVHTSMAFAKLVEEAGFPPGVFNFVFGPPSVAEYLCSHPGVNMVTFTGSAADRNAGTRVGRTNDQKGRSGTRGQVGRDPTSRSGREGSGVSYRHRLGDECGPRLWLPDSHTGSQTGLRRIPKRLSRYSERHWMWRSPRTPQRSAVPSSQASIDPQLLDMLSGPCRKGALSLLAVAVHLTGKRGFTMSQQSFLT